MTDTPLLALPLVQPNQAQKHVTVNEALARLDALVQLRLASVTLGTPPVPVAGTAYGVPLGAVNAWAGQGARVAIAINGGWEFVTPQRGWQAQVMDAGHRAIFDGDGWRAGAMSLTAGGASMAMRSTEIDVTLTPSGTVTTPVVFPARSIVFGVTGLVTTAITGSATGWSLGVAADAGQFGTGLGLAQNSWVNGPAAPTVSWAPMPLIITATGGSFTGGAVRLVAHFAELAIPDWV